MVDLIPIRKLYQYASLQRQDLPEGRRYIYGEQKLPSVTTVLVGHKERQRGSRCVGQARR
jgi:hypothetical protein